MMKSIRLLSIICIIVYTSSGQQDYSFVQEIINLVNIDTLNRYVSDLSGENSVEIEGDTFTIQSRHRDYPGNDIAANYIQERLEGFNLVVHNQRFRLTGRNVYAEQIGTEFPDQKYIICAHYDCYPNNANAPGADDNASGTAVVIEAARILSNYSSRHTIVYALWDEEEQGLLGSSEYVNRANNDNENILGVINIDMIGWDGNNDGVLLINSDTTANSIFLSKMTRSIHDQYQIGLSPQVVIPGSGSDNLAFWWNGFSAIGVEEHFGTDWNPRYHTKLDKVSFFNQDYFHRSAKLVIGTLTALAKINSLLIFEKIAYFPTSIQLYQNYPNPFNSNTTIQYYLPTSASVTLSIYDIIGNEVEVLVKNEFLESGFYTINWKSFQHASGAYFYVLKTSHVSLVKKMIYIK